MKSFSDSLGCTTIEANGLQSRIRALSQDFAKLTLLYTVEHYDASWKIKDQLGNLPREPDSTFQKLKHKAKVASIKTKISGDLKAMWETAITARRIEQELFYALDVYDLQIEPASYITTLLEALHEAGQLLNAQAVRDGREIYENIAFLHPLQLALGFEPPLHDTIDSKFYNSYTRKIL